MSKIRNPVILTAIALVALVASAAALSYLNAPGDVHFSVAPRHFTVGGKSFTITYLASTQSEWAQGLMDKKITNVTFMLFAFPSLGNWQFYMYRTNSSLDMIWLNATESGGRVVYVYVGAPPCEDLTSVTCPRYTPASPGNYVIEAKAGFVHQNAITAGTFVEFG